MSQRLRILLVDDEINMLESLGDILRAERFHVSTANSGKEALQRLQEEEHFDLVITDLKMPQMGGMELLKTISHNWPSVRVIVLTGHGSVDSAVEAMRAGAWDFMLKPFQPEEALETIDRLNQQLHGQFENSTFMGDLSTTFGFDSIIGNSPAVMQVFKKVAVAAKSNASILITGESGTGKELVAHVIHYFSNRVNKPFVKTSCASFGEGVLESELFGHEKGSFTHAVERRKGRFELADQGTLFLDEVGDIPVHTQTKLVRVLQTKEFERVGGVDTLKVNVRMIAATHRDLEKMIPEGSFREDLFYRLNVIPIHLPPLRERYEDIPLLAKHFLEEFANVMGKRIDEIAPASIKELCAHNWPGNIRELRNVIERAVVFCEGNVLFTENLIVPNTSSTVPEQHREDDGIQLSLESYGLLEAEAALVSHCLEMTKWNLSKTSKMLKISRGTLYSKMVKLGLREVDLDKA
jgi:DNA-binding NtrC family response regulator